MKNAFEALSAAGITAYESSFTALDAYFGLKAAPIHFATAEGGLVDLARASEHIEYPGLFFADASLPLQFEEEGRSAPAMDLYVRLADSRAEIEAAAFAPLDLLRAPLRNVFIDPKNIYTELRQKKLEARPAPDDESLFEAAALTARYDYELPQDFAPSLPRDLPPESQRCLLELILTGKEPGRALNFLKKTGFVDAYWPEIGSLAGVSQSKEFHPEGDAWEHTLETFRYRKLPDLTLSLALLLHDTGKPQAASVEGKRFARHAELGAMTAERFLRRLGFSEPLIGGVVYLVRYHMLPAALPRLPLNRSQDAIENTLFPVLLELYKCDELSTFRGPEGYYEACAAYRAYLKNCRNPYRNPEGRKLAHIFLEGSTL